MNWTDPVGTAGVDIDADGVWVPSPAWLDPAVTTFDDQDAAAGTHQFSITPWNEGGMGPTTTMDVTVTSSA